MGSFEREAGFGRHEVLIETVDHEAHPAEYSDSHMATVFEMLRGRVEAHCHDDSIGHVIAFKNHGLASGASLRHPHHQIVAMPSWMPIRSSQVEAERVYHAETGRFRLDDQVGAERGAGVRVVETSDRFLVFVPHAARFSGELAIAAMEPVGPFHALPPDGIHEFASVVRSALRRVRLAFGDPDFNWMLHAFDRQRDDLGAPWRFEIVPRLASLGGFELSTGATIVTMSPEEAAERLRNA